MVVVAVRPTDSCCNAESAVVEAYDSCEATVVDVAMIRVTVGVEVATTLPCAFVDKRPFRIPDTHRSVDDAMFVPVMLFPAAAIEPVRETDASDPNRAVVANKFVELAVVEKIVVVVAPVAVIFANAFTPMNVLFLYVVGTVEDASM